MDFRKHLMRLMSAALALLCLVSLSCNVWAADNDTESYVAGDINGDGVVNQDDIVYLLLSIMFGEEVYPVENAPMDINNSGSVSWDDAVYLLLHVEFGEEEYPLDPPPATDEPQWPSTGEKLVIGLCQNVKVWDYEDNALTKLLKEKTSIDIEFMFFSPNKADARQQLTLMIAGGEKLPDIICGFLDDTMRSALGNMGFLVDCTPYLEDPRFFYYGSQYMLVASETEKNLFWNKCKDPVTGAIYGYPSLANGGTTDLMGYLGGINAAWAEKFGMKAEEIDTVEEVYQYLTKVVNGDPNGNGKKDEIGMLYFPNGNRSNIEQWIVNAYIYWNEASVFNVTDGKVWEPYTTNEFRQAYQELHKWYREGLLSDLSFSIATTSEMKHLLDAPNCYTIGIFGGNPTLVCNAGSQIGQTYTNLQVLQPETPKGGYAVLQSNNVVTIDVSITADCKNPELAFRFLDHNLNPELGPIFRYGEEGVNWVKVNGEITLDSGETVKVFDETGYPAGYYVLQDEWTTITMATWHQVMNTMWVEAGYDHGLSINPGYGGFAYYFAEGSRDELSMKAVSEMKSGTEPAEKFFNISYNTAEKEIVTEVQAEVIDTLNTWRAEFITGVKDPNNDAHWEAFVDELEEKGLYDWLAAAQSAYDRLMAN